jgi:hypothetical protein
MTQSAFRTALLDPAAAVPPYLRDPGGAAAGRRFAVYRNNVAVGLADALAAQFPLLRQLVGDAFFRDLAGVFLRAHPPRTPVMARYGEALPAFLESFDPVAHLGYLPDVARLEVAMRQSYHAADTAPVADIGKLAQVAPERARLHLAPWLRLVRSEWPVWSIWAANTQGSPPPDTVRAEDAVVVRRGFDPVPVMAGPGEAAVIAALRDGSPLAEAAGRAPEALDGAIALLAREGAICNVTEVT